MAAMLLSSAAGFAKAQGQGVAQPAGGGGLGATNFRSAGGAEKTPPGEGSLEKFEDDLFGTHKPMDMEPPGVDGPSQHRKVLVVPAPDERAKEKMDAQKNWMFSGMNELNSPQSPEELMGMPELGPDGREKPRLSAVEKYYDGLGGGRAAISNQMSDIMTMMWTVKQLSGTNSLSPMILALPGGDQALMKTLMMLPNLNHAGGDKAAPGDSASPSDAITAAATAAAADRDQKRRHDTFNEILGNGPAVPAGGPASFTGMGSYTPPQPVAAPVYTPAYSPTAGPFTPSSLSPVTGGFNPATAGNYHPYDAGSATPAISPGGLNYQNGPTALIQPSRPALPPALDPFSVNYPKRKF